MMEILKKGTAPDLNYYGECSRCGSILKICKNEGDLLPSVLFQTNICDRSSIGTSCKKSICPVCEKDLFLFETTNDMGKNIKTKALDYKKYLSER